MAQTGSMGQRVATYDTLGAFQNKAQNIAQNNDVEQIRKILGLGGAGASLADRYNNIQNDATYLSILGQASAGRGVPTTQQTPAQRNGLFPQNPEFFNVQVKNPVPYQKVLTDGNNMRAVMKGYEEAKGKNNTFPVDPANVIAGLSRRVGLLGANFNTKTRDSLYSGIPRDAAVNMYNINLKRIREDSIYSFV